MIKRYKEQKIQQAVFGILLFAAYGFIMQDFNSTLIFIAFITVIIGLGINTALIYDLELLEDRAVLKTYSLLDKEMVYEVIYQEVQDMRYIDSFYSSYNLLLLINKNDRIIKKKFSLNAEPWDDLIVKLNYLKKKIDPK